MYGSIRIRGARENNLKNFSLDIPKRRITVFTGVSGSGKSSLVFSTMAAESQRLINETYPAFVQQFMPHYGQPDADLLENISAAIIVDQQRLGGSSTSMTAARSRSTRSTSPIRASIPSSSAHWAPKSRRICSPMRGPNMSASSPARSALPAAAPG